MVTHDYSPSRTRGDLRANKPIGRASMNTDTVRAQKPKGLALFQTLNSEHRTDHVATIADVNTSSIDNLSLPAPTWNLEHPTRSMYQQILDNNLSLEGLTDDQIAALTKQEYQQLLQWDIQAHKRKMHERTIRARWQQQQLLHEKHLAEETEKQWAEHQMEECRMQMYQQRIQTEARTQRYDSSTSL